MFCADHDLSFEELGGVGPVGGERLVPGEFFGTGAVGNGTGIETWSFLHPGDCIELEIEKIGVLRNRLVANV